MYTYDSLGLQNILAIVFPDKGYIKNGVKANVTVKEKIFLYM